MEKIKRLVELAEALAEELRNSNVFGVYHNTIQAPGSFELQMMTKVFLSRFSEYQYSTRGDEEFPHRLSSRVGNVEFFTILSDEEMQEEGLNFETPPMAH